MTLTDIYIEKDKYLKNKLIPSKLHISIYEYRELCAQIGDKVLFIYGMEIFITNKIVLRIE